MKKTWLTRLFLTVLLVATIMSLATFSFVEVAMASPAYEDFTTYTETDPNSRITVTNSTYISASLNSNEDAYVYLQRGVDHFSGNFSYRIDMYVDNATDIDPSGTVWALTDAVNDRKGLEDANENFLSTNVEEPAFTFGYTSIGANTDIWASTKIMGSVFTTPAESTIIPKYIHIYARIVGGNNMKMAIYKNSDLSLVCETEEIYITGSWAWYKSAILNYTSLAASTEYILSAWGAGNLNTRYDAGDVSQTVHDNQAYNGFPDPYTKDGTYNNKTSIYCTYAVTPTIELEESYGGSTYTDYCNVTFDTWYYLLVKRVSTTFQCKVYTNVTERNIEGAPDIATLSITLQSIVSYDYVFAVMTYNDGATTDSVTVQVSNYDFQYTYEYTFLGSYNEITGERNGAVNVTAHFSEGYYPETFEVDGTYAYQHSQKPLYFRFDLTNPREYWISSNEDTATIYIFNATTTVYTITFIDLTGRLGDYGYVSARRQVNDTLHIIEKRKATKEVKVVMSLVLNGYYSLYIQDDISYDFGDILMTTDTTITLVIKGIEFPKETLLTYKYVRIYGLRAFGVPNGNITITYEDTLNLTNSVDIYVNYRNGTNAYNATETVNSFVHTWTSALNNTDYAVVCDIDHQRYGNYTWKQYFPQTFSEAPWGLDFLGTSLPFETSIIIPALLILFAGGCFSVINAEVGAFMATVTAIILTYLGWIAIEGGFLITAFSFTILMAIIYAKRKVQI